VPRAVQLLLLTDSNLSANGQKGVRRGRAGMPRGDAADIAGLRRAGSAAITPAQARHPAPPTPRPGDVASER
jgi:hypothetical protein